MECEIENSKENLSVVWKILWITIIKQLAE